MMLSIMIFFGKTSAGAQESIMKPTTQDHELPVGAQYRILDDRGVYELLDRPRGTNTWPDGDLIRLS